MKKALSLLAAVLAALQLGGIPSARAESLSLFVFNVGKADCLLLRSGETAYLIDTGRGRTFDLVEKGLADLGVTHLDGVLITHTDSDHVGGLKKLLKSDITVDQVYASAFYLPEKDDEKNPVLKAADKQEIPVRFLQGGDSLPLSGGSLEVLGPLHAAADKEDNNSLVLLARTESGSMLLAGDMEFPEESDLLTAGVLTRADVLKVGNHGDDDATSEALLSAVQPQVAIISTSTEEKSSTPAARVLRLLEKWQIPVFLTQETESGVLVILQEGTGRVYASPSQESGDPLYTFSLSAQ